MKPVIIIAIAFGCSVAAVLSIQFLFIGDNEIIVDNKIIMDNKIIRDNEIIKSVTFDCAKQWDEYYDFYNTMDGRLGSSYEQSMKTIKEFEEIAEDFIKNRCASTVNDWAFRTQDENTVWHQGIDWKMMKEGEDNWHKENP